MIVDIDDVMMADIDDVIMADIDDVIMAHIADVMMVDMMADIGSYEARGINILYNLETVCI